MKHIIENNKGNNTFMKLLLLTHILFINISLACTPMRSAVVTTEEAIIQSESIILATALGSRKDSRKVLFETDEVISGKKTRQYFEIDGYIVDKSLTNKGTIPYKKSRRKTGGLCNANDYERGSTYLLMLKNGDFWTVHKPVNEKINGRNDPWLMWVKGFLAGRKNLKRNIKNQQ